MTSDQPRLFNELALAVCAIFSISGGKTRISVRKNGERD
jgi:hypothetical protein